ncbi:MAG: helix-turn-helix domain-containing protein [Hyphomicrobium sp.]|uniref:helix-turn-helix domain-containing protein n=1 Tax=Hyphomicrobium sp. TaxID=82 RepID=UPI00132A2B3B|nr:helix-turn-helix domain-containing protein [Hyphomicrobium sp.]KAB2939969.1 MAG: helix-turn-helix domain-containing protein [Hyphomicrobium sp.]MBZ0209905.1 helix-turn-helix domain-containing protein [Hyphomicrobium sp.]
MLAAHPRQTVHAKRPPAGSASFSLDERMAYATVRRLLAKEHVFCEGDDRDHVFRVEEGVIAVYKTLPDGRRQIIDFAYPGDLIGLGVLGEHVLSAQATVPSKVRCLSASALERIAETDAGLALKLYKSVCQELAATRSLLVTVGQRSAIERVAAFLVALHRRTATDGSTAVKLAMRRSDIADLLGLTIETVSRTLTKLRAMSVIDIGQGGTRVDLCDLPRLTELANE